MPVCSVVSFSTTVEILIRLYRRGRGEHRLDTAQTIGPNCGVTHSPGKIEYNCRYFLMTFRKRIHKNKFSKNATGYYVPPPIDQCLKFKNHCSLMHNCIIFNELTTYSIVKVTDTYSPSLLLSFYLCRKTL
jgi:hypothetical protein